MAKQRMKRNSNRLPSILASRRQEIVGGRRGVDVVVRAEGTYVRANNTPEACFKAAVALFALGVVFAVVG